MALLWPLEASAYANAYAAFLGDQAYARAIAHIGNLFSDNAHETIP